MTTTVRDRITTPLKAAQTQGSKRAQRIRNIVSGAATETFGELKGGTADLESLSRQSLAELVAQLQAQTEAAETGTPTATEQTASLAVTEDNLQPVPTWRQIIADLAGWLNGRKGPWTHQLLVRLDHQLAQYDQDMTTRYGDEYRTVAKVVARLRTLVQWAMAKTETQAESPSVAVEVLTPTANSDAPPTA